VRRRSRAAARRLRGSRTARRRARRAGRSRRPTVAAPSCGTITERSTRETTVRPVQTPLVACRSAASLSGADYRRVWAQLSRERIESAMASETGLGEGEPRAALKGLEATAPVLLGHSVAPTKPATAVPSQPTSAPVSFVDNEIGAIFFWLFQNLFHTCARWRKCNELQKQKPSICGAFGQAL
jgi:hypothetical protein